MMVAKYTQYKHPVNDVVMELQVLKVLVHYLGTDKFWRTTFSPNGSSIPSLIDLYDIDYHKMGIVGM